MKLFLEKWRYYLGERFEDSPKPFDMPDLGEAFPKIDVQDIVLKPTVKTTEKVVLLDIFNQLETEADESKIKSILYSLYTMSGNSQDFNFKSKEEALKFYKTPYVYKTSPEDSKPTKSLKDWHEHLKVINKSPASGGAWADRGEKIKAFRASAASSKKRVTKREVDPYGDTGRRDPWTSRPPRPIPPTLKNLNEGKQSGCEVVNNTSQDMSSLVPFVKDLYSYSSKKIGFNNPAQINFDSNLENSNKILGKTAHYEPSSKMVTVYVDNRHPKDILRSIAHELVHHAQNCRGEFDNEVNTNPGYAQEDGHMREMEREAYEVGNMTFRDWEDTRKKKLNETIYKGHNKGDATMSVKDWKNKELNSLLMEKWGFKQKEALNEALGHDFVDTAATAEKHLPEDEKPVVEVEDDETVVEEEHPMSADQRLKNVETLDEEKLRSIIREKVLAALKEG